MTHKVLYLFLSTVLLFAGCVSGNHFKKPVKVLVLPKFEVGEMTGDEPGEAQFYYEGYCVGGEEYDIAGGIEGGKLYYRDGVALYLTGMGKANAAASLCAVLSDSRFDFSKAYILGTGCAGGAVGMTTMGDVVLGTAACDCDLGHTADFRDIPRKDAETTWYHDQSYDSSAFFVLDQELVERVYDAVKSVSLETTELTSSYMRRHFDGADWAVRKPSVVKGTIVSGDNYWKGEHGHKNADLIVKTYGLPYRFAASEMEDVVLCNVAKRFGMLDRLILLRDIVDMTVFMGNANPDSLWGAQTEDHVSSDDSAESFDIFPVGMKNNFAVGDVIIGKILDGTL